VPSEHAYILFYKTKINTMSLDTGNNQPHNRFRGIFHIAMGVLYVLVGAAVIFLEQRGSLGLGSTAAYIMGIAMIAYGLFRGYRGYKRINGEAEGW
jgi:hypothetical protein